MSEYTVVFDLMDNIWNHQFSLLVLGVAPGLLMLYVSVSILAAASQAPSAPLKWFKQLNRQLLASLALQSLPLNINWAFVIPFSYVAVGFSCLWLLGSVLGNEFQLFRLLEQYQKGQYTLHEGVIHQVKRPYKELLPTDHYNYECFSINQQRFCYSESALSGGFNATNSIIKEDLAVRVFSIGETIIRLEVVKPEKASEK